MVIDGALFTIKGYPVAVKKNINDIQHKKEELDLFGFATNGIDEDQVHFDFDPYSNQ